MASQKEETGFLLITTAWFLSTKGNLEGETTKISRMLSNEVQGFGRVDAGWRARVTTQDLRHHGPRYNIYFYTFLHDVTFKKRGFLY